MFNLSYWSKKDKKQFILQKNRNPEKNFAQNSSSGDTWLSFIFKASLKVKFKKVYKTISNLRKTIV